MGMGDLTEEMKLLDTEALKIRAREDDVAGSTSIFLFDLWSKSIGDVEALRMAEVTTKVGGCHGFIFSSFVVLIVVMVVIYMLIS